VCNIMIAVSNSIIGKSRREKLLNAVRGQTGGEKCCENCGKVEWIENVGENDDRQRDTVAMNIIEPGDAWVKKVTDRITPSTKSIIFTFRTPFDL